MKPSIEDNAFDALEKDFQEVRFHISYFLILTIPQLFQSLCSWREGGPRRRRAGGTHPPPRRTIIPFGLL